VALLQALQEADVWTQRAQMSFGNRNWTQADAEFKQVGRGWAFAAGILVDPKVRGLYGHMGCVDME
jgi:hypothetical protein